MKLTSPDFIRSKQGKSTPQSYFEAIFTRFGAARCIWGSDFPHTKGAYKDLVDMARDTLTFLEPADRERYFAGTARTLWRGLAVLPDTARPVR